MVHTSSLSLVVVVVVAQLVGHVGWCIGIFVTQQFSLLLKKVGIALVVGAGDSTAAVLVFGTW